MTDDWQSVAAAPASAASDDWQAIQPKPHFADVPFPDAHDVTQTKYFPPPSDKPPEPKAPDATAQGKAAHDALMHGDIASAYQGSPAQSLVQGAIAGAKQGWGDAPLLEGRTPQEEYENQQAANSNPIYGAIAAAKVGMRGAGALWGGAVGAAHNALVDNGMKDADAQRLLGDLQLMSAVVPEAARSGAAMADMPAQQQAAAPKQTAAAPRDAREAAIATPGPAADVTGDAVSATLHPKVAATFPEVKDAIPDLAGASEEVAPVPGANPVPGQQGAGPQGNAAAPGPGAGVPQASTGGIGPQGQGAGAPSAAGIPLRPQQRLIQDFDRSGVQPTVPAISDSAPAKILANIAERVPGASSPMRQGVEAMRQQTQDSAQNIADQIGTPATPDKIGEAAQQGVQNFAKGSAPAGMSPDDVIAQPTRNSSVQAKAGALYDRARSLLPEDNVADISNTMDALKGPMDRFDNKQLGALVTNPKLRSFFDALSPQETEVPGSTSMGRDQYGRPMEIETPAQKIQTGGTLTVGELGELGSSIGRMLGEPQIMNDIPRADLSRVYGGIMDDMRNAASEQGPDAVKALDQARTYYKAAHDRVDTLDKLTSGTPEQVYGRLNSALSDKSSGNINAITALKRSMPPQDWNNFAATVINRLGSLKPGATDQFGNEVFSPARFSTAYDNLTPQSKSLLFGEQADSLDALSRVAKAQQSVARLGNASGSGSHAIMAGVGAGLVAAPISTVSTLLGARAMSSLMMNPGFTRWLYNMPRMAQSASAAGQASSFAQRAAAQLSNIASASRDPAMMGAAQTISQASRTGTDQ